MSSSHNTTADHIMSAAIVAAPRQVELVRCAKPAPAAGQVRVRLEGCGICASNLPVWQGRSWFAYPLEPGAPGHEGWGEIDAVGDEVEGLRVGDRVAALSFHAYAEYDLADADSLVRLPVALGDRPFPGEPLGCAMNIWARSAVEPQHTVAVVGVGFLGALLIRLAKQAGARVIAASRRDYALEVARRMGADEVIATRDLWQAECQIRELTDQRGCERVIEAGGLQATLDLASRIAAERARLIVAGFHQDGPRQVDLQQWNWLGLDVINAHERAPERYLAGMRAAAAAVAEGRLDPFGLYTHQFALDDLDVGFSILEERPDGFLKGLLML